MNDGDQIDCPWCGEVAITDLWEVTRNEEGVVEEDCDYCGRTFLLDTLISVMTTAKRGHGTPLDESRSVQEFIDTISKSLREGLRHSVFGPITPESRELIRKELMSIAKKAYTPEKYARSFVMEEPAGWFGVYSLKPKDGS